jgi:hypothetical protein
MCVGVCVCEWVMVLTAMCMCMCVCVCVICGKVFRGGESWFLFGASIIWESTNPSNVQSRASPRVYTRGRNSSVSVRTTHKPERLAQYRASATDWMIVESGFDSSAEHRFLCLRVWAAATSSTNRSQLSRCLHAFSFGDKKKGTGFQRLCSIHSARLLGDYTLWYVCLLQFGWHPVAVVHNTFTHKQYTVQYNETEYTVCYMHNNKNTQT